MSRFRPVLRAFLIAFLAIAVMALVRDFIFVSVVGFTAPVMPFILAVIVAARIGGSMSGLFATVLGAGMLIYLFDEKVSFQITYLPRQFRIILFFAIGGLISWAFDSLHAARQRIEDRRLELEREVSERRNAEAAERAQRERLAIEMRRREEAEMALREREERIRMAVESAEIGTWDFNPVTGERTWSDRAKVMFGLPPGTDVTNVLFLDRIHPEDRDRAEGAVKQALDPSGDGAYDLDCRLVLPNGTIRWFTAKGQAFFRGEMPNRRAIRFIGTVLDITDRKQAHEALRASENRLQAILNNSSAVVYLKDAQSRYLMINRRFEELFKIQQAEIAGKTDAEIFPGDVVAILQANDRQIRETGQPLQFEEVVPQDDGPHTYISVKFPVFNAQGQCNAVGGISTDITDRKKALEALEEEQELLRHTIEVQDQERQLVTYEIHDGLVQYATAALMQLESIRDRMPSNATAEQIENVVGILRKTIDEGRRIINGIHATVLDDCGVVAAVQQLIDDEERAHVQVEFVKDDDLGRMASNIEVAIYHIAQEALTNVYKHSQSKKVQIELARRGDRVHLEVRDRGVGFTTPISSQGVHGLRGMSERARIAGGQCVIRSVPGKGTQVIVDLPYLNRN